jgi:hypothetical protein
MYDTTIYNFNTSNPVPPPGRVLPFLFTKKGSLHEEVKQWGITKGI